MEILLANYKLIIGVVLLLVVIGYSTYKFFTQPSSKQKEQIRVVLLELVLLAEKMYGSKTGKVKLAFVYSELLAKFPSLRFIPFSVIEKLIDESLEEMKQLLKTNPQIANIVKGE